MVRVIEGLNSFKLPRQVDTPDPQTILKTADYTCFDPFIQVAIYGFSNLNFSSSNEK